jgi:2-iminoacetate synthase
MSAMPNLRLLSDGAVDFIDDAKLDELLVYSVPDPSRVRDILAKSLDKQPLSVAETAVLANVREPSLREELFAAARQLKERVYGNRIVLFAPLYIGSDCVNHCTYCAFQHGNRDAIRRTLTQQELGEQVLALEAKGHKRLILVWGEHPRYDAEFMAECVRTVYQTRTPDGKGEIRRVNINAAPLDVAGYKVLKAAGIGTYQIFQETYHHATYAKVHPPRDRKGNYLWRLDGLARAMEAGCDDVGFGALFGLYDWRFEVLGLVSHALHFQQRFGVGPHTISFPRLQPACGVKLDERYQVPDEQFKQLIAILRLAVPYTGLILTARENPDVRRACMAFGVSQIDAGSRIEIGGYTEVNQVQALDREQFELGDVRSLDDVMRELLEEGYIPSFCTACYRLGRTGEHFMEFAIPGFIKRLCTPNALTTLQEYLTDYSSPATRAAGERLIAAELAKFDDGTRKAEVVRRLEQIRTTAQRDLYF